MCQNFAMSLQSTFVQILITTFISHSASESNSPASLPSNFPDTNLIPHSPRFNYWSQVKSKNCPASELIRIPVSPIQTFMMEGSALYGDTLNTTSPLPCWLNLRMVRLGQNFARKNLFQIIDAHFLSLFMLLADDQITTILYDTGRSETPAKAFKRYTSTLLQVKLWYDVDILHPDWWKSVKKVREIHNSITPQLYGRRKRGESSGAGNTNGNRRRKLEVKVDKKLWTAFQSDFENIKFNFTRRRRQYNHLDGDIANNLQNGENGKEGTGKPKYLFNQFMMTLTQWAFVALPVIETEKLAITQYKEMELQGFAHLWAVVGYSLGMDERFILCRNALENMGECKKDLRRILEDYFIPALFKLNGKKRVMMESLLRTMGEIVPSFPPQQWLVHLLTDIFGIDTSHLKELRRGRLTGSRFVIRNVFKPLLDWPGFQRVTNFATRTGLQLASVRTFGDPGINSTVVAEKLYYLD